MGVYVSISMVIYLYEIFYVYLFGGCNVGGCVLLVNLENTLSSVGRSRARRDRVGEEGGVASDEVASLWKQRKIHKCFNTGFSMGLFQMQVLYNIFYILPLYLL